jgi:hypothetical protein
LIPSGGVTHILKLQAELPGIVGWIELAFRSRQLYGGDGRYAEVKQDCQGNNDNHYPKDDSIQTNFSYS